MPPKFSLQSVLEYRKTRVEILEVGLSQMHQIYQREKDHLALLFSELERFFAELTNLQQGEFDLSVIAQARQNIKFLQTSIASQQIKIQELEKQLDQLRQEVIQAKQDETVMEKLSEKEIEKFEEMMLLRDKQTIDDIYNSLARLKIAREGEL